MLTESCKRKSGYTHKFESLNQLFKWTIIGLNSNKQPDTINDDQDKGEMISILGKETKVSDAKKSKYM